jgi:uncharacterized integral membrane protein
MRLRNVLYIVIGLLVLVLLALNWSVITQSTELKLIFATVQAPLGVLLLLIAAAILAVDFAVYSLNRLSWTRERRELAAQIEQHRLRADQAEESRIRALRETLEQETAVIRAQLDQIASALRIERQR